jgi:exodeoxyribonuclease V gamma subunit
MTLAGIERWAAGEAMVRALMDGVDPAAAEDLALARGLVPLGTPGGLALRPVRDAAARIAAIGALIAGSAQRRSAAIDLCLGGGRPRVVGTLDGVLPCGRLAVTYSKLDDKRRLRLWIAHLALCAAVEEGLLRDTTPTTWVVGRAEKVGRTVAAARIRACGGSRTLLERLVDLWLEADSRVPPFYALASRAYATRLASELAAGAGEATAAASALRSAADAFGSGRDLEEAAQGGWGACDLDDPELSLALGDALPWDPDGAAADGELVARFEATARGVYEPLDAHWEEQHDHDAVAWVCTQAGGAP